MYKFTGHILQSMSALPLGSAQLMFGPPATKAPPPRRTVEIQLVQAALPTSSCWSSAAIDLIDRSAKNDFYYNTV